VKSLICRIIHPRIVGICTALTICAMPVTQPVFAAAAGKPTIAHGTIVTDKGDLLRGCCAHISAGVTAEIRSFFTIKDNVIKLRDQAHMNVIRICVLTPKWGGFTDINQTTSYVDAIVANCEAAGIYAIVNYHGELVEDGVSSMDFNKFWEFYSPRYKDKSFVIYEIENEIFQCVTATTVNDWPIAPEASRYKMIRRNAPNNMITGFVEPVGVVCAEGPAIKDIFAQAAGIDWNANDAVWAWHAYIGMDEKPLLDTRAYGLPVFCTEFSYVEEGWSVANLGGYNNVGRWCEEKGISWIVWQQWQKREPDQLKSVMAYSVERAQREGWTWWTSTATAPATKPAAALRKVDFLSPAATTVLINGRVIKASAASPEKPRLSILPGAMNNR